MLDPISRSKTGQSIGLVLPDAADQIIRVPGIESAVAAACEDIDVELRHLESIESNCAVFGIKTDHNRSYRRVAAVG